jgi:hypothetical protein
MLGIANSRCWCMISIAYPWLVPTGCLLTSSKYGRTWPLLEGKLNKVSSFQPPHCSDVVLFILMADLIVLQAQNNDLLILQGSLLHVLPRRHVLQTLETRVALQRFTPVLPGEKNSVL